MADASSISKHLRTALEAVDAAEVPDDLRQLAFEWALDRVAGAVPSSASGASSAAVLPAPQAPSFGGPSASQSNASEAMVNLASKLKITVEQAELVFDIDDDGLHLLLGPERFSAKVTKAMGEIATLVAAGRQAAGLDSEWSSVEPLRQACENRGRYSQGNFAASVKALDGKGFRVRGSGRKRDLKANAVGYARAGELAKSLLAD